MTKKRSAPARPARKRASGAYTSQAMRPFRTDEHDEPIVVDNFPLRIDFGKAQATTPVGNTWERKFPDNFHQLIAIFEDENGVRQRHEVRTALQGANVAITFDLARESNPSSTATLTFTLVPEGTGKKVVMTPQNDAFVLESSGEPGRLKPQNLTDLRLTKVTVGSRPPIVLKPGSAFKKKVMVVIVAEPE